MFQHRLSTLALTLGLGLCGTAQAAVSVGNIQVYNGNTLLGYLSKVFDGQNSYTWSANVAQALLVQIDDAGAPFDILALNGPDAAHPYVGAVGGSGGYSFASGQLGYAYLSGTGHTAAGALPSTTAGHAIQSLGYNAPAESMIWSLTGQTLSARWVNSNGSTFAAATFYDPSVDFVGLVGDFARFTTAFPSEGAYLVTLRYVASGVPEPTSALLLGLGVASLAGLGAWRRRQAG